MTTTIEKITQLMTTTPEEEVIQEIKIKRKPGRPKIYTPEELRERKRACDRLRYHADPAKKIEANRQWRQQLKST